MHFIDNQTRQQSSSVDDSRTGISPTRSGITVSGAVLRELEDRLYIVRKCAVSAAKNLLIITPNDAIHAKIDPYRPIRGALTSLVSGKPETRSNSSQTPYMIALKRAYQEN